MASGQQQQQQAGWYDNAGSVNDQQNTPWLFGPLAGTTAAPSAGGYGGTADRGAPPPPPPAPVPIGVPVNGAAEGNPNAVQVFILNPFKRADTVLSAITRDPTTLQCKFPHGFQFIFSDRAGYNALWCIVLRFVSWIMFLVTQHVLAMHWITVILFILFYVVLYAAAYVGLTMFLGPWRYSSRWHQPVALTCNIVSTLAFAIYLGVWNATIVFLIVTVALFAVVILPVMIIETYAWRSFLKLAKGEVQNAELCCFHCITTYV